MSIKLIKSTPHETGMKSGPPAGAPSHGLRGVAGGSAGRIAARPVTKVRRDGNWSVHAPAMWEKCGWAMLGTIDPGNGSVGALARAPRGGHFYKINGSSVSGLNQRDVIAALTGGLKHYF